MYQVSDLFKTMVKSKDRMIEVKAIISDDNEYREDSIESFTIEEDTVSDDFEIGTVITNKLTLKIRLDEEPEKSAKIELFIRMDGIAWQDADINWEDTDQTLDDFNSEWAPIGTFYVDSRSYVDNMYTFEAYDILKTTESTYDYSSISVWPSGFRTVLEDICANRGITIAASVSIDNRYDLEYDTKNYTEKTLLGYIASIYSGSFKMNRDNELVLVQYLPTLEVVETIGLSNYFDNTKLNNIKTITKVTVTDPNGYNDDYSSGSGDEENTITINYPYGTQDIADDIYGLINGFSYQPFEMNYRCFPYLESGDLITIDAISSSAWNCVVATFDDYDKAWDGKYSFTTIILNNTMYYTGGIIANLESPSKSEEESEYSFGGTLTEQVKTVSKNVVENSATISILDDEIELKVSSDGVIAAINLSPETIQIEAEKIELTGYVTISNLTDGTTTISGDNIQTGTIDAIDITGCTITGNNITGGTINGTVITGTTITGNTISGGSISGGSISGGSISGTEYSTLGSGNNRITIGETGYAQSIRWLDSSDNVGCQIFGSASGETLLLNAGETINLVSGDDIGILSANDMSITCDELTINTDAVSCSVITTCQASGVLENGINLLYSSYGVTIQRTGTSDSVTLPWS
jgi:hypothetical protein